MTTEPIYTCTRCNKPKPAEAYCRRQDSPTGLHPHCKEYRSKYQSLYRQTTAYQQNVKRYRDREHEKRRKMRLTMRKAKANPTEPRPVPPCENCGTAEGYTRAGQRQPARYDLNGMTVCHECRYPPNVEADADDDADDAPTVNNFVNECRIYLSFAVRENTPPKPYRYARAWSELTPAEACREIIRRATRRRASDLNSLWSEKIIPSPKLFTA